MGKTVKRVKKTTGTGFAIRLLVLILILFILIKHSIIFLIAGMLPAIVASIVDQSDGRILFRTVLATNTAGIARYMAELISQNNSREAVHYVMSDPGIWLVVYTSAAIGWILFLGCPKGVEMAMDMFSDNKVKALEQEQQKLEAEWGPKVTGHDM